MTPGADPALVGPYLAKALDDPSWKDSTVDRIAGGKSNLTYIVRSPAGEVVLRRPPLGDVLPTAHDMAREVRVQRALRGSAVPVPDILVFEDDPALLGQPFYVMDKVDGVVVRERFPPGCADTPAERRAVGDAMADTLVAIHDVDWGAAGLEGFGRPEGFLERQVRRWTAQFEASKAEEFPQLEQLGRDLADFLPTSQGATLVHGDFRLDNTLLDPVGPRIAAVLDWELSTLGDPMVDLGLALVYHMELSDDPHKDVGLPRVTAVEGYPTRAEFATRYAERSGRSIEALPWYVAFGAFKMAVLLIGIAMRVRSGAMAGESLAGAVERVPVLAELGRTALAGRVFEPR